MKSRPLPFDGRGALVAAAFLLAFAPAQRARAQQAAVNPFTHLGRVMDASHAAFDTNRVATISASDAKGTLLAKSQTFFLPDSRRNYRLQVPLADAETEGYSQSGAVLLIAVEDDARKVWSGVVVDAGRAEGTVVGEPGGVREVDIVLGEDMDGDGIDDALYARLAQEWEDSDFWSPDGSFDPNDDHDGDGVPTIAEALAGTNPFNAADSLRITAFELGDGVAADGATSLLRHPFHPQHDGLRWDFSTPAPSGDILDNYKGDVKPETFSVRNSIQLFPRIEDGAERWNPQDAVPGGCIWTFDGLRREGTIYALGDATFRRVSTLAEITLE